LPQRLLCVLVILLALISLIGCDLNAGPTIVVMAPTATLQGPIVPTRGAPVATPTSAASSTPTFTATTIPTITPTPNELQTAMAQQTGTAQAQSALFGTVSALATGTRVSQVIATANAQATATEEALLTMTAQAWASATVAAQATATPTPLLSSFAGMNFTNPTSAETINIGDTLSGTISDQAPAVLYTLAGRQNAVISIEMTRLTNSINPFLLILDPEGREIARNDDESASSTNALIAGLRLVKNGNYTIVATRYWQRYGSSTGTFNLTVAEVDPSTTPVGTVAQPINYNTNQIGMLDSTNFEQVYTFKGTAGDIISIQMSKESGNLDTSLILTDTLGNEIFYNDDDLANDTTNSYIRSATLSADGFYSIVATRYQTSGGSSSGNFRLKFSLEQAGTATSARYAALDPADSGTISSDGTIYIDYSAGDRVSTGNVERKMDGLLTFFLPILSDGQTPNGATLTLGTCVDSGVGFAGLGALTIYEDPVGRFTTTSVDMTHLAPDARILATVNTCDPLDVTDIVNQAYASGIPVIQFRLAFADIVGNNQGDKVAFSDPRLSVTLP